MAQDRTKWASIDDVESQVDRWDGHVLQCRTYGHHWEPYTATFNTKYLYYTIVQVCPSCLTERHSELDQRGHVIRSSMHYPDGYLTKDMGRIVGSSRDALRVATINRLFKIKKERKGEAPKWMEQAS